MNRGSLPSHLPRIETIVDLDDKTCPCCKGAAVTRSARTSASGSTLADWAKLTKGSGWRSRLEWSAEGGRAAFLLRPAHERLLFWLKRSGKLFADETTAPVLDRGRGRTKTGQLWAKPAKGSDRRSLLEWTA